jgi:hypothetical protein
MGRFVTSLEISVILSDLLFLLCSTVSVLGVRTCAVDVSQAVWRWRVDLFALYVGSVDWLSCISVLESLDSSQSSFVMLCRTCCLENRALVYLLVCAI